jgi:signal transduction histidine kinase
MFSLYLSYADYQDNSVPSWQILYVDYPLKALLTLPVWYFVFRVLENLSPWKKLMANLLFMPFWIKGWQLIYYWICRNFLDGYHLMGSSEWWDIYIPGLFFTLQFGIFHAWHYHKNFRITSLAQAEAERLALSSELNALKAQLNPHFLYNSLNTISASVGPEQENTRRMIANLSDLFRYQLAANRRDRVRLGEELDFVSDYLRLEHARFGERLHFSVEANGLEEALIPPLLIQPLVENAVRHGISPSIIGGEVRLEAQASEGQLQLTIFNTGRPCDPEKVAKSSGYGLCNTRRRLQLLFNADLHLSSNHKGTTCTFTIPLKYESDPVIDRRRSPRPEITPGVPEPLSGVANSG